MTIRIKGELFEYWGSPLKILTYFFPIMRRKVVQQGPATLMISLPSKCVKEHNIKKGDEIEMREEHGKLIVTLDPAQDSFVKGVQKGEFDVTDFGFFNEYFVNYFYQKGYDEITVHYTDPAVKALIEKRAKELIGFEIVEEKVHALTLRMLMKIDEQEFETVLKKLFQVTLVMGDELAAALDNKEFARLREIARYEKENNRYCDLCIRVLYKNRYKYPEEGFALFTLLRELEQVGDLYKDIAESFSSKTRKELFSLYTEAHQFFRVYYDLYYAFDKKKIPSFFLRKDLLLKHCTVAAARATKEDAVLLAYLMALVQAVFDLKGPLFLMKV